MKKYTLTTKKKQPPRQAKCFQKKRLQNIQPGSAQHPVANPNQSKTILQEDARLFKPYHTICSNIDQTFPYLICNYGLYVFTRKDLHLELI